MHIVDARGLPCPQPVLKTKQALESISQGEEIQVLVDNEVSLKNVQKFVNFQGHQIVSISQKENYYIIQIKKTSSTSKEVPISCELDQQKEGQKNLFLIITSNRIGEEKELGKILMKGFFETMLVHELLPDRIFFMNKGVFLTTTEEEFVSVIKELEKKGVEIFTCGTCLKYFNLEDKLQVGHRAGTDLYLEAIFSFKKVVWIG